MASNKTRKPDPPELGELAAVGGDDIGYAYANELRLPSDNVLSLRGNADLRLYEKVLTDPEVKSTFQQRRFAVTAREWYVEPGGDAAIDLQAADSLSAQLKALHWDAVTRKMLTGIFYGYAVGECMFGVDGSSIVLTDIKVRRARRFRFDRENNLRLVTRANPEGAVMPPNKFWVFRAASDDDDDPYGLGLAPFLYWPVWFKRNGLRHWPTFLERFANPTPVAKVPPGTDATGLAKVMRMLADIKSGGRIAVPNNIALELLQALRSSGGDFLEFCKYMDLAIDKIVLSQTMTTNDGASKSQAVVHDGVKLEVVRSDADMQCESFNAGPARWLTEWNYPGAKSPRVWRRVVQAADLKAQSERDTALYQMGYEPTQEYVNDTYGPGFVKRKAPSPGEPSAQGAEFAEPPPSPTIGPASTAVEQAIAGDEWRPLLGPEVESIEGLLADCSDLAEMRDRLGELAQRNPDAVTESLARVMFAARAAGQAGLGVNGDD